MAPKLGNQHYDKNLNNSKRGQGASACKVSVHSSYAFSRKYPEIPNLTRFIKLNRHKKEANQQAVIKI